MALAKRLSAGALQLEVGHHGLERAAFRLEAHGIDGRVDTPEIRALDDGAGGIIDVVEVDRLDAVGGPREFEAICVFVDHEDPLRAEEPCRRRGRQAHRSRAEDRHRRSRLDLAIHGGLVAGGQDVREEQHLFVGEPGGISSGPTLALGTRTNSAWPPG